MVEQGTRHGRWAQRVRAKGRGKVLDGFAQLDQKRLGDVLVQVQTRRGDADLAAVARYAGSGSGDGLVEVGIAKDYTWRFAPQLERHPLQVGLGRADSHQLAGAYASREADLANASMLRQGDARRRSARKTAQQPVWESGLGPQGRCKNSRQRVQLARLDDEALSFGKISIWGKSKP